jgi:hypothetical protein
MTAVDPSGTAGDPSGFVVKLQEYVDALVPFGTAVKYCRSPIGSVGCAGETLVEIAVTCPVAE